MDCYQFSKDKDSQIVNDPNDGAREHDDTKYILNLLKSIITVSVATMKVVNALAALNERKSKLLVEAWAHYDNSVYSRCWCSKATTYEDENYSGGCGHVQGGSGLGARSGTGAATGGTNRHATLHFQRRARGESEPAVRGQLRTARGTIGD